MHHQQGYLAVYLPVLALAAPSSSLKVSWAQNRVALCVASDAQLLPDVLQQQGTANLLADYSNLPRGLRVAGYDEARHAFQPWRTCQLLQEELHLRIACTCREHVAS